MDEQLRFALDQGMTNLRDRFDVAAMIQREANTTLALLLAGGAASLGGVYGALARTAWLAAACVVVALWLFWLAYRVVSGVLTFDAYPSLGNVPKNLDHPGFDLDAVVRGELLRIQVADDRANDINTKRSKCLNRVRILAAATPLIAVVGATVAALFRCVCAGNLWPV